MYLSRLFLFLFRTYTQEYLVFFLSYKEDGIKFVLTQQYIPGIHPGYVNAYKSTSLFKSYITFYSIQIPKFICGYLPFFIINDATTDFAHTNLCSLVGIL